MKKILALSLVALSVVACSRTKTVDNDMVFFAFDSAEISKDANKGLHKQAKWMKKHSDVNITLAGHCDERGTVEYNLALGALRAGNAAHALIKEGVPSTRIKTISYGKDRPQFLGTGEKVWSKNRNVTTTVDEAK